MEEETRDPTARAVIPRARSVGSSGLWIRVLLLLLLLLLVGDEED